jgi:hypothetical protein
MRRVLVAGALTLLAVTLTTGCQLHSPWQRGTNENAVSLVVIPEGVSGRLVSAA